jgi:LysR family transcriptional regulator for bpeEF and oprC
MDQLAAMRTLLAVAGRQSFIRAADDLGLSRAMVSTQIAWLERHLGVRLLNRTTRRVTLTADGSWYLERSRALLAQLAEADEAMRRTREVVKGRLRVDVPVLFGRAILLPVLPRFTARYPEVALDLQFNDGVVDLVAERVDVAVRFSHAVPGELIARRIGTTRHAICASPAYLESHGLPARPEDLAGHRLIGQTTPRRGKVHEWSFAATGAGKRSALTYALTFDSVEGVLQAALGGLGIMQSLDIVVSRFISEGRLQRLLDPWSANGPPVSVVYQRAGRTSATVRVFADFLAQTFEAWTRRHERPAGGDLRP